MEEKPKITSNLFRFISLLYLLILSTNTLFSSGCSHTNQSHQLFISKQIEVIDENDNPGTLLPLQEYAWLYIPNTKTLHNQAQITLAFHFHTAVPYAIREHRERGAQHPLIIFNSGSGSRAYKVPFENTTLFSQLQHQTLVECIQIGADEDAKITEIEISSFSAGYGAVREILKTPAYVRMIKTVILTDSMYAGYTNKTQGIPVQQHIQSFVDFAKLAFANEKTFLISYSKVFPETYASTEECAAAIVQQMGGELEAMDSQQIVETDTGKKYPMIARYDHNGLHVWGFAGDDANAHVAHVHSLSELWDRLEP